MLQIATRQQRDKYLDWAYSLALDLTKSSYPTFTDGIKTKKDFVRGTNFAFDNECEEILLFSHDDQLCGWVQYYFTKSDNFVATYTFLCENNSSQMVAEFLTYVAAKYPSSDINIGLPSDNVGVRTALLANGFQLEEKSYNCVLHLENYSVVQETSPYVNKIGKEDFEQFRKLHDKIDVDMYWNSDRIFENFENWHIYLCVQDNEVQGAIYCMNERILLEVFGIDYAENIFNEEVMKALFVTFLNDCKINLVKHVCYFAETLEEASLLKKFGFDFVGEYNYFVKKH